MVAWDNKKMQKQVAVSSKQQYLVKPPNYRQLLAGIFSPEVCITFCLWYQPSYCLFCLLGGLRGLNNPIWGGRRGVGLSNFDVWRLAQLDWLISPPDFLFNQHVNATGQLPVAVLQSCSKDKWQEKLQKMTGKEKKEREERGEQQQHPIWHPFQHPIQSGIARKFLET